MKSVVLLLCFLAASVLAETYITQEFLEYAKTYGKVYESDLHMSVKAKTYADNVAKINAHNADLTQTWQMGINQFTDMNEAERLAYLRASGPYQPPKWENATIATLKDLPTAPDSYDWRQHGAVNPIRDQGQCGTCWTFASTGAVESSYFVHTQKLPQLSEAQQVSCDTHGGSNEAAFAYLKTTQACSRASFPYTCPAKGCQACTGVVPKISGYTQVPGGDGPTVAAIAKQPVAIGIAASGDFMSYKSGIYNGNCNGGIDHAVMLVGYGSNFYILRNSWGTGWGEAGYMRITRTPGNAQGKCLCTADVSYPTF